MAALASIPSYQDRTDSQPVGLFSDEESQDVVNKKLVISVNVGSNGLGVVVVPSAANQMLVKEYRAMPDGVPNPSKEAGLLVGDVLLELDGTPLTSPEEAVKLLRKAKGIIKFTVKRQ